MLKYMAIAAISISCVGSSWGTTSTGATGACKTDSDCAKGESCLSAPGKPNKCLPTPTRAAGTTSTGTPATH